MALPTVADLKIHLNMTTSSNDGELADVLDAAVEMVSGLIGPITASTVTETHYGVASPTLLLRQMPVADVLSISSRSQARFDDASLTLSDYALDHASGVVRLRGGGSFYGDVTVTYSAGRAIVPADIRLAILIIAAHMWETQRMPGQSMTSAPAGFGGADGIPDASSTSRGFAMPNRAQELLQRYIRPAIA